MRGWVDSYLKPVLENDTLLPYLISALSDDEGPTTKEMEVVTAEALPALKQEDIARLTEIRKSMVE